jgi:ABC-type Zn uptake system ZnuABC Zn-binding protein ZnuA
MKRVIILLSMLILSAGVNADDAFTVVCTTTALEALVEQVGGDCVDVVSLVQPGVCPSHFDVRPSHVDEVSQSSLVVYHGVEPWLEGLIEASQNTDVEQLNLAGEWNTPALAAAKIEEIRDVLVRIDPENADYYKENAEKGLQELDEIKDAIKREADALDLSTIPVLCMGWQKFLVEWMGFTIAKTYAPPETLSIKDVNELIETGIDQKAVLVIDNLQSGTDVGSQVAAAIGARHVVLTNFPNAVPETDTITKMIEYNAHQLLDAVREHQKEKGELAELESELQSERLKRQIFEALAVILLAICIVEAVILYRKS